MSNVFYKRREPEFLCKYLDEIQRNRYGDQPKMLKFCENLRRYIAEDFSRSPIGRIKSRGGIYTEVQIDQCVQWAIRPENEALVQVFIEFHDLKYDDQTKSESHCANSRLSFGHVFTPQTEVLAKAIGFVRVGDAARNKAEIDGEFIGKLYDPFEPNVFIQKNEGTERHLRHVFRCLSAEDGEVLRKRGGIECKQMRNGSLPAQASQEWLNEAALCHVLHGSKSRKLDDKAEMMGVWISTTKGLGVTMKFAGLFQPLVLISVDGINKTLLRDFEDEEVVEQIANSCATLEDAQKRKIMEYAKRSREVLIYGQIPKENVRILTPDVVDCKIWPFCDPGSKELTNADVHKREALLRKLLQINAIPEGENALFPSANEIKPDVFELVCTLGSPNDRTSLCKLRCDLQGSALKKGTVFILKQAKPNVGHSATHMVSDAAMIYQLRLAWIANSCYQLLSQRKDTEVCTPKCCLYEYKANFRDFMRFRYVEEPKVQGSKAENFWLGSFLLCRYDEHEMKHFESPEKFNEALNASITSHDKFLLMSNLIADCLLGVSFCTSEFADGDIFRSKESPTEGLITRNKFLRSSGVEDRFIRLPVALEFCLGCSVFPPNSQRFKNEENVLKIALERAACFNGKLPIVRGNCMVQEETDWWKSQRRAVLQLMVLLDNSTNPSKEEAGCNINFTQCMDSRLQHITGFRTEEEVTGEWLRQKLQAVGKNRIALLYADPLNNPECTRISQQYSENLRFEAVGKNMTRSGRMAMLMTSMESLEVELSVQIATLSSLLTASCTHEVMFLNADLSVCVDESVTNVRLALESEHALGVAEFVSLHHSLGPNLHELSKKLAKFLRWTGVKTQKVDDEGYISISDLLQQKGFEKFAAADIQCLLENSDVQRFKLSSCGMKVRAAYGHSQHFSPLSFKDVIPIEVAPNCCVYGCTRKEWQLILTDGIERGKKDFITLYVLDEEDSSSGQRVTSSERRGTKVMPASSFEVLVYIDVIAAMAQGYEFFEPTSTEKLIHTKGKENKLAPKYFSFATDSQGTEVWCKDILDTPVKSTTKMTTLISQLNDSALKLLVIFTDGISQHNWTSAFQKSLGSNLGFEIVFVEADDEYSLHFMKSFLNSMLEGGNVEEALKLAARFSRQQPELPTFSSDSTTIEYIRHRLKREEHSEEPQRLLKRIGKTNLSDFAKTDALRRLISDAPTNDNANKSFENMVPAVPTYGRQSDLFQVLNKLEFGIVNVWGVSQTGKSALAAELERYCSARSPYSERVLRITIDDADEMTVTNFWNYIDQKAQEVGLALKRWQVDDLQSLAASEGDRVNIETLKCHCFVSLLIIDAGEMSSENLVKDLQAFIFFSQMKHHDMDSTKTVIFSQECLNFSEKNDWISSYELPTLDVNAAMKLFTFHRSKLSQYQFQQNMQGKEEEQRMKNLFEELKTMSPSVILRLAHLSDSDLPSTGTVESSRGSECLAEKLEEVLFNMLTPDLRHALLACSTTPDLFKAEYLKDFNDWSRECWKAFLKVELFSAGSKCPLRLAQPCDAEEVLSWMLESRIVRDSKQHSGAKCGGQRVLNELVEKGFVHSVHYRLGTGATSKCSESKYYRLSDATRSFCIKKIAQVQKTFPQFSELTMQRKRTAVEQVIVDLKRLRAFTEQGRRNFSLMLKNWRWAVEQCFLEVIDFLNFQSLRINEETRNRHIEPSKAIKSVPLLVDFSRRKEEAEARDYDTIRHAFEWARLLTDLLWVVRRFSHTLITKDILNAWIQTNIDALCAMGQKLHENDYMLTLSQNHLLIYRVLLDEYNAGTFEEALKACDQALRWPCDYLGAFERSEFQEGVLIVSVEAYIFKGILYSKTCRVKEAQSIFGKAQHHWVKLSGRQFDDISSPGVDECDLFWIDLKNHWGNLYLYNKDFKDDQLSFPYHEQLYKRFEANQDLQASFPKEYYRCLHNIAICRQREAKSASDTEREDLLKFADRCLIQAHQGRLELVDDRSIRGLLDLCDTRMKLMDIRIQRDGPDKEIMMWSAAKDYDFRRNTHQLLTCIHAVARRGKIPNLPPRIYIYTLKLRRSCWFETQKGKGCYAMIKKQAVEALASSLHNFDSSNNSYEPYQPDRTQDEFLPKWSERCPEDKQKFYAIQNDIFSSWELCQSFTKVITACVDTLLPYYKTQKGDDITAITEYLKATRLYCIISIEVNRRNSEWGVAAQTEKQKVLNKWRTGCPDPFANMVESNQHGPANLWYNPLLWLLQAPTNNPAELLSLLAISLVIEFCCILKPIKTTPSKNSSRPNSSSEIHDFHVHRSESLPDPQSTPPSQSARSMSYPVTSGAPRSPYAFAVSSQLVQQLMCRARVITLIWHGLARLSWDPHILEEKRIRRDGNDSPTDGDGISEGVGGRAPWTGKVWVHCLRKAKLAEVLSTAWAAATGGTPIAGALDAAALRAREDKLTYCFLKVRDASDCKEIRSALSEMLNEIRSQMKM